jgi:hypothetical protein
MGNPVRDRATMLPPERELSQLAALLKTWPLRIGDHPRSIPRQDGGFSLSRLADFCYAFPEQFE